MGKLNIEQVIKEINENKTLYLDFKYKIGEALIRYVSTDKKVDLENFKNNFNRLQINYSHSIIDRVESYSYNPVNGIMTINQNYLGKPTTNRDNIYMQMVLDLLFSNKKTKGFDVEGLHALNKGFRETLASNVLIENGLPSMASTETFDSDEYLFINLIGRIIEPKLFEDAFKTNNPDVIKTELNNKKLTKINELMEYNVTRNYFKEGFSALPKVQLQFYQYCVNNNIECDDMIVNMALDKRVFENSSKYVGLDSLKSTLQNHLNIEKTAQRTR